MNAKKMSTSKPIISVVEACVLLQLSRSRYYQLVQSGFLPKPLIDERSKRPYYDEALQQKLLECRETGIGMDGSHLLFYSPRKKGTAPQKKQKMDPVVRDYRETLESMGLEVTVWEIQEALLSLYPNGANTEDQGLVIRKLYRHFKQK